MASDVETNDLAPETISLSQRPGRVLVAEDNPINLKMLVYYLSTLEIAFDAVGSGREVLDALALSDYDLILMDCLMPDLDGYEATARIRQEARAEVRDIPIIGVTSQSAHNDEHRCRAVGMNDYLAKPLRLKSLEGILDKWLPIRRPQD